MTFIDSNVPMYVTGAPHPHKLDSRRLFEGCISDEERLVTDAKVYQEILHRYVAIEREDAIQPAFEALLGVVGEVFPIELPEVERAKGISLATEGLSARDALHLAVIERRKIERILSFDTGFDSFPGISRLPGS